MAFCNSLEEVRAFFAKDRFATENGAVIEEYGKNYAKIRLDIKPEHKNALGNLMGGATFTIADFAFAVASNWEEPGTVAISSTIDYNGVAKGNTVYAVADCVKDGRSTCCYIVSVKDDLDNLVATVMITGFKTGKR